MYVFWLHYVTFFYSTDFLYNDFPYTLIFIFDLKFAFLDISV